MRCETTRVRVEAAAAAAVAGMWRADDIDEIDEICMKPVRKRPRESSPRVVTISPPPAPLPR